MSYLFAAGSGLAPILTPAVLSFGFGVLPWDDTYDMLKYVTMTLIVFIFQLIGGGISMEEGVVGNTILNTLLTMSLYSAIHYFPLFLIGKGFRTLKSIGKWSEIRLDAIFLTIASIIVFAFTHLLRITGVNVTNKYAITTLLVLLVLITWWNISNNILYTSSPIEYPFRQKLSKLPLPIRVGLPIGLQLTNKNVFETLKNDPTIDQNKLYYLEQILEAFKKSLPGYAQPLVKIGENLPISVLAKVSGIDIRSGKAMKGILNNPLTSTAINMIPIIQSIVPMVSTITNN